jgi:hypothetical protein
MEQVFGSKETAIDMEAQRAKDDGYEANKVDTACDVQHIER